MLVHVSPGLPGCVGALRVHMSFRQTRSGSHASGASHSAPALPKACAGWYGFGGMWVRAVRRAGAGTKADQVKVLRAVAARERMSVSAVRGAWGVRRGLIDVDVDVDVLDGLLER